MEHDHSFRYYSQYSTLKYTILVNHFKFHFQIKQQCQCRILVEVFICKIPQKVTLRVKDLQVFFDIFPILNQDKIQVHLYVVCSFFRYTKTYDFTYTCSFLLLPVYRFQFLSSSYFSVIVNDTLLLFQSIVNPGN